MIQSMSSADVFTYDSSDSEAYFSGNCSVLSSRHHSICSAAIGSSVGNLRKSSLSSGALTPTKAKNISQAIRALWQQVMFKELKFCRILVHIQFQKPLGLA